MDFIFVFFFKMSSRYDSCFQIIFGLFFVYSPETLLLYFSVPIFIYIPLQPLNFT